MDLFKLVGTIAIKNTEANKAIDETTDKASKTEGKFKKFIGGVGKATLAVGKVVATGIGVAATGLATLSGAAMSQYSNYEQLVGGVETLFKNSSEKVVEYADNAYKTAGMSANAYMETVTSFSASLLQSLDGDTQKASEKANQAVIDMSDNANKMGTDITMIQNAYQGFAKQNYTMLDNLKLGYGGTKQEMERLLEDAEKISGIKYDISSFADITDAIHVMQESMDIAGTTSKEASTTIQGSILSMKGAWTNFLTGMADPTQDFDALVKNLFDSIVTVAENVVPRLTMLLPRLIEGIAAIVQAVSTELPAMIEALLPALISGAVTLMQSLVAVLPSIIQVLVESLPLFLDGIIQIFTAIVDALPEIITIITNVLPDLILQIVDALIEALPILIEGGITLTLALVEAMPVIIQALVDALPEIVGKLVDTIVANLPMFIDGAVQIVLGLVQAIPQIIMALILAIPKIIEEIVRGFSPLAGKLIEKATTMLSKIKDVFTEKWNLIKNVVTEKMNSIKEKVSSIITNVKTTISGGLENAKNAVSSKLNAIKYKFSSIFDSAKNIVRNAIDKIRGFFNFEWSLPKIKLPHFNISGEFSLNPPSIPHFDVSWYKKAIEQPYLFTEPTIFDYDQAGAKVAGEAGDEVMYGKQNLLDDISAAVSAQNNVVVQTLEDLFDKLFDIMEEYFPEFTKDLVLDTGVLVAQTADAYDERLGLIQKRKGR